MRKDLSPFKLGLFVLIGATIVMGGLLWIGVAHVFKGTKTYVSYFEISIRGLNTGADVSHLGISIGKVSDISLVRNGELVRVLMKLNPHFVVKENEAVELKMAGIAGGHYLALVEAPPNLKEVTPKITFQTKYPLIPSVPGTLTDIENALETAYKKFQKIDFQGLATSIERISKSAENILSNKEVQGTLKNLNEASAALKSLLTGISGPETAKALRRGIENFTAAAASAQKATESLAARIDAIPPNSLAKTAKRMERTSAEAEKLVGSIDEQVTQSLNLFQQSVQQMDQAFSNLKGLAQSLKQEPGQILNRPKGSEPFGR